MSYQIFVFCLFVLSEILNVPSQTQLFHTATKLQSTKGFRITTTRLMGSEPRSRVTIMTAMLLTRILTNSCGDKNRFISTSFQDVRRLLTILAFFITLETIFYHFCKRLKVLLNSVILRTFLTVIYSHSIDSGNLCKS